MSLNVVIWVDYCIAEENFFDKILKITFKIFVLWKQQKTVIKIKDHYSKL